MDLARLAALATGRNVALSANTLTSGSSVDMLRMRRSSLDRAKPSSGAPLESVRVIPFGIVGPACTEPLIFGPGCAGGKMDGGGAALLKELGAMC